MQVDEIMTRDPACCTADTPLSQVAQMMLQFDCGEIPVVESMETMIPIGVITDRDITCRSVAQNKNPLEMSAGDCMSSPCVTIEPSADLDECCNMMEEQQLRRMVVVDEDGACCGIVSQADIARSSSEEICAEVVREVSRPSVQNQSL